VVTNGVSESYQYVYLYPFPKHHSLHPEDGGSKILWHVGILPQRHMVSTQKTLTWKLIRCHTWTHMDMNLVVVMVIMLWMFIMH